LEYDGNPSQDYKDGYCRAIHDVLDLEPIPTLGADEYEKFKADYKARLKADMVAMLTDIQLEIREYHEIGCDEDCNNCRMVGCVEPVNVIKDLDIIQQKIDALKADGRTEEC
jgi:hypothetical protein